VGQTRLLARTFFARLFESDLMPDGLPQVQLVIWGMLLAATPTTAYAIFLPKKYQHDQFFIPLGPEFDADRMILITLSMIAIGVVGLVIWDGVFPDRRDVRILGPLPIPTVRFVAARLAALARVFVLFATPLCLLQSLIFGLTLPGFGAPYSRLTGISAHLLTVAGASAFVFLALIAAQCFLLLTFGRRAAQAASVTFQIAFTIGLVQLLFFLPELGRILRHGGRSHEGLSALAMLPPTWFFGLSAQLTGGGGDAGTASLARFAVGITMMAAIVAVGLYAATYGHLSRRALEGSVPRNATILSALLRRLPTRRVLRPVAAAVRQFTVRTLVRSRSHRMMLAVYGGFALAFVMSSAVSIGLRDHGAGLWTPGMAMLSMPLIVQFLLLVGIRVIIAIPSEPKARWVFRACEPVDRAAAVSGTRDAMLLLVVLPTTMLAFAQGLVFWSAGAAVGHAVYSGVLGRLLAEVLVPRTGKLPFTCTYLPGKSRVFTLWPFYLIAFVLYSAGLAELERFLLTRPQRLMVVCAVLTLAAELVVVARRRRLAGLTGVRFEEEDPNALFQGFQLSEALAAAPRAPVKQPAAGS
jgi:hypothetical protein